MSTTLQTLKGFRDFLPAEKKQRDHAMGLLRTVFERHGFSPVETPTLEYADILLGKYGEEADKLVYTFLDRGDRKVGLRYDQTVPTARFVSEHQSELPQFFRRYQMQNVFRAEKPQKGRFREFLQCDCDVFGSTNPIADAEILSVFFHAYHSLGLREVQILVNDRVGLLSTLTPFSTPQIEVMSIVQSVDKLDKMTAEEVVSELTAKGMDKNRAFEALAALEQLQPSESLRHILALAVALGVPESALIFRPQLARGLDYYTGLIFEAVLPGESGSLGGGGRYDRLLSDLGGPDQPAVGFGIGFDRTLAAAASRALLPISHAGAPVLVVLQDQDSASLAAHLTSQLREQHIGVELVPEIRPLGKQYARAESLGARYVVVCPAQSDKETFKLKTIETHELVEFSQAELISTLTQLVV